MDVEVATLLLEQTYQVPLISSSKIPGKIQMIREIGQGHITMTRTQMTLQEEILNLKVERSLKTFRG